MVNIVESESRDAVFDPLTDLICESAWQLPSTLRSTDAGRALIVSAEPESLRIAEELKQRFGQEKIDALLDLLGELAEIHEE